MKVLLSAGVQLLWFGAFAGLLSIDVASAPSAFSIALFVAGVMGSTSLLCTAIARHWGRGELPDRLVTLVMGFILSHLCILCLLPPAPPQSNLAWMELVFRVGLCIVMVASAAALSTGRELPGRAGVAP